MTTNFLVEMLEKQADEQFATQAEKEVFKKTFMEKIALDLFGPSSTRYLKNTFIKEFPGGLASGTGKAVGALAVALIGAGIAKGLHEASAATTNTLLHEKFENALSQALLTNRIIRSEPEKARQYAETIFKFAPHVAADPNLLTHTLANVIQGEVLDMTTIKTLVDLEGKYLDNNTPNNIPRF